MIQFPKTTIQTKKEIVLTAHQNKALNKLLDWHYNDNDNLFYCLKGSAGTGKTTVLKEFITRNRYTRNSIAITAPTHKAKKVAETVTGLQGLTIQGVLGLRPNTDLDNFDINNPQFDQKAEALIKSYRLIILDEASMLNKDLHELIVREAKYNRTKILFIGDTLQLPPVNETMSLALTSHTSVELTEVIRQANTNPILNLLNTLRDDIFNNTNNYISLISDVQCTVNEEGEGYEVLPKDRFTDKIVNYFHDSKFYSNPDFVKYIAWTNEAVFEWNKFIRFSLFTTNNTITKGDLLMSYTTVVNEYQDLVIINSEDYLVDDVTITTNTYTDLDIPVYRVNARSAGYGITTFDVVHESGIDNFLTVQRKLHSNAIAKKGRAWVDYYKFKNKHILSSNIMTGKKLLVKKDIDYGYAITVHKTQGSTYENVFVNLPNIMRNPNLVERKKLIYVALSRASKKAFILKT